MLRVRVSSPRPQQHHAYDAPQRVVYPTAADNYFALKTE
jgi:hypothetical protein